MHNSVCHSLFFFFFYSSMLWVKNVDLLQFSNFCFFLKKPFFRNGFFQSIDGKIWKNKFWWKKNFLFKKNEKQFWKKCLKKKLGKSEKKIFEFFFWKHWKKFARKECGHFNEVGRKILLILFVLLVLAKIKLWTRWNFLQFFFFHQRIYDVNLKKIGNGPNFTTISATAATEIKKKVYKSVFFCGHT